MFKVKVRPHITLAKYAYSVEIAKISLILYRRKKFLRKLRHKIKKFFLQIAPI